MRERHVLVISLHFPPSAASGSNRIYAFAKYLPRFNWSVSVVAAPSTPWEPIDSQSVLNLPLGSEVTYVTYPMNRAIRRLQDLIIRSGFIDAHAVWCPSAWNGCRRLIRRRRPDAILTSGPPHSVHLIGSLLSKHYNLPWIADFRDPWWTGALSINNGPDKWARYWERTVFHRASVVIGNAPRATDVLRASFPKLAHKFVTITNGFDRAEHYAGAPTDGVDHSSMPSIVHSGAIYYGRDPKPFFSALRLYHDSLAPDAPPLHAFFYGLHEPAVGIESELNRLRLGAVVSMCGQVPQLEALKAVKAATLLLLLDTPGRQIGVPAKLYEYMGAERPILALAEPDSDVARTLRASGILHRVAKPLDTKAIYDAMCSLLKDICHGVPAVGDSTALDGFTRVATTQQLSKVMEAASV
jgi:hypothetical protein